MNTSPAEEYEDPVDDNEVLVMNFWDTMDELPIPTPIKIEDSDNDCQDPSQKICHESGIKFENHAVEDIKQDIIDHFDLTTNTFDEYILGAEPIADNFSFVNSTEIENQNPVGFQDQTSMTPIVLDSDSDDSSDTVPALNIGNKDETSNENFKTYRENGMSSVIITNITSVVDDSENTHTNQFCENSAREEFAKENSTIENRKVQASIELDKSKQVFQCEICSFCTKTRFSLSRHVLSHTNKTTNVEKSVKLTNDDKKQNQSPLESTNSLASCSQSISNVFRCKFCSFTSKTRFALKRHILTHTDKTSDKKPLGQSNLGRSKCKYCSFVAKNKVGLANHVIRLHKNKKSNVFICKYCSFVAKSKAGLVSHVIRLHKNKKSNVFKCKYCSFVAKSKAGLISHVISLHKNKKSNVFKCNSCSFVAKRNVGLVTHIRLSQKCKIRTSVKNNDFQHLKKNCIEGGKQCDETFTKDLTSTRKKCTTSGHSDIEKNCYLSNSTEKKKTVYASNKYHYSSERKYQCEYCSYSSNFEQYLNQHVRVHTIYNHPIYKCNECSYKTTLNSLVRHKALVHKGVKYLPPIKKIASNIKINDGDKNKAKGPKKNKTLYGSNKNQNSSERKYQCEYCSFSSNFEQYLNQHVRIHTIYNHPIYKCNECSYKATANSLSRHKALVHKCVKYLPPIKKSASNIKINDGDKNKAKDKSLIPKIKPLPVDKNSGRYTLNKDKSKQCKNTDSTAKLQCMHCSFTTKLKLDLKTHLLLHTKNNEPIYHCNECNFSSTKICLSRHMTTVHGDTTYDITDKKDQISFSDERTFSSSDRKQRYQKRHSIQLQHIKSDGDSLDSKSVIMKNTSALANSSNIDKKENYAQLSNTAEIIMGHLDLNALFYVCEMCGYVTNQKEKLITHKLTHAVSTITEKNETQDVQYNTEKTEQCADNAVLKSEKNTSETDTNRSINNGKKREAVLVKNDENQCTVCKRTFRTMAGFRIHKCSNDPEFAKFVIRNGINYTCKKCPYTTHRKHHMKRHFLSHNNWAAFTKSSNLVNHASKVHGKPGSQQSQGRIKNKSDTCTLKTSSVNTSHKKRLICDICGYNTLYPLVMENHKKYTHKLLIKNDSKNEEVSDKIKYKCDACDFKTNYKHNLQNHKILHININEVRVYKNKTYNVKIQDKISEENSNQLGSDVKTTLEKSSESAIEFPCKYCEYKTKIRFKLKKHFEKVHSKNLKATKSVGLCKKEKKKGCI